MNQQSRMRLRIADIWIILAVLVGWLACAIAQFEKYFSIAGVMGLIVAGSLTIVGTMFFIRKSSTSGRDLGVWPLVCTFAIISLAFLLIYPLAQKHSLGPGSDREDALRVGLVALVHHQYPYEVKTFLHGPPTPMPGAMFLASPFFFLGRIALQNLVWLALFVVFLSRFFAHRSTALVFLLIFLVGAAENLNDFTVGGDFVTNIMYVAIAMYVFAYACDRATSIPLSLAACLLLGITLSSRIIYLVGIVPLFALAMQRRGVRQALLMIGAVLLVFVSVSLSVMFPHPLTNLMHQLLQNSDKVSRLPKSLKPLVTLPLAAFLITLTSFRKGMNLARAYLVTGLATLVMILPSIGSIIEDQGGFFVRHISPNLEYLAPSAIFISLWLFSFFENAPPKKVETRS